MLKCLLALNLLLLGGIEASVLKDFSNKLNRNLPEVYDSITKLERTSVEGEFLVYQFVVDINEEQFKQNIEKIKKNAIVNSCTNKNTLHVVEKLKKSLLYRYENLKGQSLGQFQILSGTCSK